MKKYILLLSIITILTNAFCQEINKKLIYGHWNAYYVSNTAFTIHTDSIQQSIGQIIKAAIALAPEHILSPEDSLEKIKHIDVASIRAVAEHLFCKDRFFLTTLGTAKETSIVDKLIVKYL